MHLRNTKIVVNDIFSGMPILESEMKIGVIIILTYFQNFNHSNGVNVSFQKVMPYTYPHNFYLYINGTLEYM